MAADETTDIRHWAHSLQRTERTALPPERAVHYGLNEAARQIELKELPADFAERVAEQRILRTPGMAEGFDHANKVVKDWMQSL